MEALVDSDLKTLLERPCFCNIVGGMANEANIYMDNLISIILKDSPKTSSSWISF